MTDVFGGTSLKTQLSSKTWLSVALALGFVGAAVDSVFLARGSTQRPASRSLASYAPTPISVVNRMLEMADVGPDDVLYDLGSGDGRVLISAARNYGARAVGVELNYVLVSSSRAEIRRLGLENRVQVRWDDIARQDLASATVVTIFLSEEANRILRPKLERELPPGTRVVTYYWQIEGWQPARKEVVPDFHAPGQNSAVYLYRR